MKKFISLAVALAMVLSVVPMFGLTASAATETVVLFDASVIDKGSYHGDIDLAEYGWTGNEHGIFFSSQWSESGTWDKSPWGQAALMFFMSGSRQSTDEDKVATLDDSYVSEGAEKIVIEYNYAMRDKDNNYQTWYFNDLDGNTFATVYYDQGVKANVGHGGSSGTQYADNKSAVYALRGTPMKIEAVKGTDNWTVTYTSNGKKLLTETVESVNGFGGISADIGQWNDSGAAMGLQGLKISCDITGTKTEFTVNKTLPDGSLISSVKYTGLEGQDINYGNYDAVYKKDGKFYAIDKENSTLGIKLAGGGENTISVMYKEVVSNDADAAQGNVIADGATCWFADPRTLTVKNEDGSKNFTYIGYIDNYGAVKATQYDNNTGEYEEVLVRSNFQPDDHNNPSFLELPDHHIMIIYSRHTDEACFYYRVSKEPYDITTLAEEHRLRTEKNTTYPNPFILSSDNEHFYMGWRGIGWHPTLAQLEMPTAENGYTTQFTWGPKQVVQSTGARPYAKYTSNGEDEIWVTYTTGHPDNEDPNWLYFNRINISSHDVMDVYGNKVGNIDDGTVTVNKLSESRAFAVDTPLAGCRDWVWEVVNYEGHPVIAMVKISSDKKTHDYWYAYHNGSKWIFTDLPDDTSMNTKFHQSNTEWCYSGGMSIDKADPHQVYASVPVMGANGKVWEIVKYTLNDDFTAVESIDYITKDSVKNNARPYVANGSAEGDLRLTWFNGDYYFWINDKQFDSKGFPVQMMTNATMKELPVINDLGSGDSEVYDLYSGETAIPAPTSESFTVSIELLQNNMGDEGTLLESGNLKIELAKQTVDNTHDYAAVAPQITVNDVTEKSQNLLSEADGWYKNVQQTDGSKSQYSLGWINYVVTYDAEARELVTYVNGLIDATMQNVDVNLGDVFTSDKLLAVASNVRTANAALTQAEVRAADDKFTGADIQTIVNNIFAEQIKANDYDTLTLPEEIYTDFLIPTKTNSGKTITWSSNNTAVITNNGVVIRDSEAHDVTLTASFNGQTKEIIVHVPARVDVMAENMVLHYDFNNVKDGKVPDLSGNGYDAEVKGTKADFSNGKLDLTANTADGWKTNGYLNVPYDFLKDIRSYTVVQQVKGGTDRNDPRLYDFGRNGDNSVFTRLNTKGANQYQAGLKYNGASTPMVSGGPIVTGEYWLVTTYSAKTKETKIFTVDASGLKKQQASGTNVDHEPYEVSGGTERNYIGRTQWWAEDNNDTAKSNQDFNGTIDNFMFFNTALTDDEIKTVVDKLTVPTPEYNLGWDGENFTIDFAFSGGSVKVYKNGEKNTPVAEAEVPDGKDGVAFATTDTNACYQAVGVRENGDVSKPTEVVSVYALVAEAVAGFAEENPDTLIVKAQLDKAIEVLNNGGVYIENNEITSEANLLMNLTAEDSAYTITLNDAAYGAGLRFKNISGYAIGDGGVVTDGIDVVKDGKEITITVNAETQVGEVIYLQDIEFDFADTFDESTDEQISGELDFVEEV